MTSDHPAEAPTPPERRAAVWPWLLVPLVALALFFALRSARTSDVAPPEHPADALPAESVPTE